MVLTNEDITEALKLISEMDYDNMEVIDKTLKVRFPHLTEVWSILPPLDMNVVSDDGGLWQRRFPASIPVPQSVTISEDQLDRKTISANSLKTFAEAICARPTLAWGLVQKYPGGQISMQVLKRRILKRQPTLSQFRIPLPPLPASPAVSTVSCASSSGESLASIGSP